MTCCVQEEVRAYIGLGSNLQQPQEQIQRALDALRHIAHTRLHAYSGLYRSPALEAPGVPVQADYINAVAVIDTRLSPYALLSALQHIEQCHGRVRNGIRWGPRPLDLDILLYAHICNNDPQLSLPHPELAQRAFVLYPLYECAPDLCLPDGRLLVDLIAACPPTNLEYLGAAFT
jgi:2-amino-4-hydroxy-6-hydroxymethyldihydropteridine diphosphokinase